MEQWIDLIQKSLYIFFWVILPGVVIFFRIKKKIRTGFAVGVILTSFILGVLSSASVTMDPVDDCINKINENSTEAKSVFKQVIQGGPEYLEKLDENKIIYRDRFERMKKEIISEYYEIAERYYRTYNVTAQDNCDNYLIQRNYYHNLKHALVLVGYAESIGGNNEDLKAKLEEKIDKATPVFEKLEEKCD